MICKTCLIDLPIESFQKRTDANCYRKSCKDCIYKKQKALFAENPGLLPMRQRRSYLKNRDKRIAHAKAYSLTEKGREVSKKAGVTWRAKNPVKAKAHRIFHLAVKHGKIKIPTQCSTCPSEHLIEAHHDDYSKPLDVVFLCRRCHLTWHMESKLDMDGFYEKEN
jgi:hypothetical protein